MEAGVGAAASGTKLVQERSEVYVWWKGGEAATVNYCYTFTLPKVQQAKKWPGTKSCLPDGEPSGVAVPTLGVTHPAHSDGHPPCSL